MVKIGTHKYQVLVLPIYNALNLLFGWSVFRNKLYNFGTGKRFSIFFKNYFYSEESSKGHGLWSVGVIQRATPIF